MYEMAAARMGHTPSDMIVIEDSMHGVEAAKALKGSVRIFTVGAGSPEGTIIALPGPGGQTEYLKDAQGQIVKSRLDEERLRTIAEALAAFLALSLLSFAVILLAATRPPFPPVHTGQTIGVPHFEQFATWTLYHICPYP